MVTDPSTSSSDTISLRRRSVAFDIYFLLGTDPLNVTTHPNSDGLFRQYPLIPWSVGEDSIADKHDRHDETRIADGAFRI